MLFLSDAVNADENSTEIGYLEPPEDETLKQSVFDFAEKRPTVANWKAWKALWKDHILDIYKLSTSLGQWMDFTRKVWEWFHDAEGEYIDQKINNGVRYYW